MRRWATSSIKKYQFLLVSGDIVLYLGAVALSILIQAELTSTSFYASLSTELMSLLGLILGIHLVVLYVFNQYDLGEFKRVIRQVIFVLAAEVVVVVASAAILFFVDRGDIGLIFLGMHALIMSVALIGWRQFFVRILMPSQSKYRLAVLGEDPAEASLVEGLLHLPIQKFDVVLQEEKQEWGLQNDAEQQEMSIEADVAVLPQTVNYTAYARKAGADVLVYSIKRPLPEHEVRTALALQSEGVTVYDFPAFCSRYYGKIPVFSVTPSWILETVLSKPDSTITERVRRLSDIVVSGIGLVISAPIMLGIALAIKVGSRGPVFFVQERLGQYERPFQCFKFRTMVPDAEKLTGPKWAESRDPRITPIGHFLRKSRLDELPQLWNVWKGEMSIVGFRPIRKHFADLLDAKIPFYRLRFGIKPGLTGWPQVRHDYAGSVEGQIEKFEYELFYLANRSLILDAYIMVKTVQVMLFGRGQ